MKTIGCVTAFACAFAAVCLAQPKPEEQQYWTKERIQQCLQAIEKLRAQGVMSERRYQQKRRMLEARLAGKFKPTALATKDAGEVNFIQNGGFEQINRNSARDRSRWLWWGGWSWGGDYENFWSTGENAHSGEYGAGIRCVGRTGRIGINTPPLPIVPGATEYVFTVWAKGEGENMLFVNFESGCRGTLREKVGPEWTEIVVRGTPQPDAKDFRLYIYAIGAGTIYLDDAKLVPVGAALDE
jgi:hypothetical protein